MKQNTEKNRKDGVNGKVDEKSIEIEGKQTIGDGRHMLRIVKIKEERKRPERKSGWRGD